MSRRFVFLLIALFSFHAPRIYANVTLSEMVSGLSAPVDIANAGDGSGRLFVVEQSTARIRVIENGTLLSTPFLDLTGIVATGGERGLLGLAFHPQYATNGYFFVYYTSTAMEGRSTGDVVIARFQCCLASQPNRADPATRLTVLTIGHSTYDNHNGGALRFGPDGYLYAGVGDGGSGGDPFNAGQNLNTLLAKILRIDINTTPYVVPPTNPFAGGTGPGGVPARPEIWAWGVRNPWRLSFDRVTGDLYIGDVGQGEWEEVNRQSAGAAGGANYGWRIWEGNHCYPPQVSNCTMPANYQPPLLEYSHGVGVSITGGYVYRGLSTPDLAGRYVFGDFSYSKLFVAPGDAGATFTQLTPTAQVSTFGESESGELYLANYANGRIYSFSSSTDNTPDQVRFFPLANVARNAVQTSNTVRITGLGVNAAISITGGEYSIGCGAVFSSTAATIANATNVCVRHPSSSTGSTTTTTTLTIGTSSFIFTSTTRAAFVVTPSASAGGSIAPAAAQTVDAGNTAIFTVSPSSGYSVSVGGTCGGTLSGNSYTTNAISGNCTVIANFTPVAPVPPGAPTISQVVAGDGLLALYVTPPASDGGAPITGYTATCTPGSITGSASTSPVIVSGLSNGSIYDCSVAAINSAGSGASSAAASGTPSAAEPLALLRVASRKTHGSAGSFDWRVDNTVPIGGAVTVEPRLAGPAHRIVFRFNQSISAPGTATVTDAGSAPIGSATVTANGFEVIVTLSDIADNRRANINLAGVNGSLNATAALGFLAGDINKNLRVTAADIAAMKTRLGQTVSEANFHFDLDGSGTISGADLSAMKSRAGKSLQ